MNSPVLAVNVTLPTREDWRTVHLEDASMDHVAAVAIARGRRRRTGFLHGLLAVFDTAITFVVCARSSDALLELQQNWRCDAEEIRRASWSHILRLSLLREGAAVDTNAPRCHGQTKSQGGFLVV